MIISHSRRFIYFSNPKTGSESVRQLLQRYNEEEVRPFAEHGCEKQFYPHMRPMEARSAFLERGLDFDRYYRFVFTRNPWDRLVSLFEMIHGHSAAAFQWKRRARRVASRLSGREGDPSFAEWVRQTSPDGPGGGGTAEQRWRRYGTYSLAAFASDRAGKELVDTVVRLEHVDLELPAVFSAIGLPPGLSKELPRRNRRLHVHYSLYYNEATRDLVSERYAHDIDRFGYRFDSSAGTSAHD